MTMLAAFRTQYCLPADLQVEPIDKPEPDAAQILVRMMSCTVNRTDCAVLTGKPAIMRLFIGLRRPRRPVTGTDFAGEVVAVGSAVTQFKIGDRVWGFDDEGLSSHAQFMLINADGPIALMPSNIGFVQAAAGLEAAHYARSFLDSVELTEGDRVLVNGATGAIGSALVQFLVARSINVTAVANSPNIKRILALGADRVYDYLKEDFTTDTQRYRVVFDAVGKSTFGACKHLLHRDGVYMSSELGPWMQNPLLALGSVLSTGRKVKFPIPTDVPASLRYAGELQADGKFVPVIDRSYSLNDISAAFTYVAAGEKTGNVMLVFSD